MPAKNKNARAIIVTNVLTFPAGFYNLVSVVQQSIAGLTKSVSRSIATQRTPETISSRIRIIATAQSGASANA